MQEKLSNSDAASMSSPPESGESAEAHPGSPLAKLEGKDKDSSYKEMDDHLRGLLPKEDTLVFDSTGASNVSSLIAEDNGEESGNPELFQELKEYSQQPADKDNAEAELDEVSSYSVSGKPSPMNIGQDAVPRIPLTCWPGVWYGAACINWLMP